MNKQFKLWSLLIMLFIGSFATGAYARTFSVEANAHSVSAPGGAGLNTGIVVGPGKLLVISANKQDTWSLGATAARTGNANGLSFAIFGNFTKPLTNFSFLFGTLVGSLDNGLTFFPIGTRMEQTIVKGGGGTLRLYCWDANNADNTGTIAAHVEVYTGP